MRYLRADYVFPVSAGPVRNGIVAVADDGTIDAVHESPENISSSAIENYNGIICPAFVNAHCHLELSYLHNKISRQRGLEGFIEELVRYRNNNRQREIIMAAAIRADHLMYQNGISAVGDISNSGITGSIKLNSPLAYHTFIELYDFVKEKTDDVTAEGMLTASCFQSQRFSFSPHATYSVTHRLLDKIISLNRNQINLTSIHHLENAGERDLLQSGTGKLSAFLNRYFSVDYSRPEFKTTLTDLLERMQEDTQVILVHNTYARREDIETVVRSGITAYWCFCPKANLYIENRLPDFSLFAQVDGRCCIGTDSLASNDTLSVLEEIKCILQSNPELKTGRLIGWATLNGAKALKLESGYGSFEKGKRPGIILIENTDGTEITEASTVRRLV